MHKIIFVLALLVCTKFSYCQYLSYTMYEILQKEDNKLRPVALENKYDGIIGNAYLYEDWCMGRAFTSMKMYSNLKLKFDVNTNTIYLNINDTVYDITKSGIIQFDIFSNLNDTTKLLSFTNGLNIGYITPDKFVNYLSDGKIKFIKYYKKDIEDVFESSPTYKEKKLLDRNRYYIIDENQEGKEIGINKKNLEKILILKWDEVNKFGKNNNISFSSEEGWKKLIDFYNSLN